MIKAFASIIVLSVFAGLFLVEANAAEGQKISEDMVRAFYAEYQAAMTDDTPRKAERIVELIKRTVADDFKHYQQGTPANQHVTKQQMISAYEKNIDTNKILSVDIEIKDITYLDNATKVLVQYESRQVSLDKSGAQATNRWACAESLRLVQGALQSYEDRCSVKQ